MSPVRRDRQGLSPWSDVLAAVPRAQFIPDVIYVHDGRQFAPVDRGAEPDRWQASVDADTPVVTQITDGIPTSSASAPWIVERMLCELDVHDGQRVLEIGTGSGWNAALLAERLGPDNVVTIEIDQAVADQAQEALKTAGYPVTVVCGNGASGYPDAAPYDAVIVTAAVSDVPAAWVEQLRPGGRIVLPWATSDDPTGRLLTLTLGQDGDVSGHLGGPAGFMALRGDQKSGDSFSVAGLL